MKKTLPDCEKTTSRLWQRFSFILYTAAAVALLLRLITAWQIAHGEFATSIFAPSPATDLRTYMNLAEQIADGKFSGPFYYQPFYYSVFLVLIRWISGGSVWCVVFVQALLGSFTVLLAGYTARYAAGKTAGITAGILTALCNILIFYTPFHQIATLQTFNLTLLAYLAVRAFGSRKWYFTLLMGAVAAIGALTRGNILLVFAPLTLALWITIAQAHGIKRGFLHFLLSWAVFAAVESPFIIYNSIQLGYLSGPSTAADAVLALGNTPEAPPGGRDPGLPAGPMEYPQAYHLWMADAPQNPVWKKILNYLHEEPAAYLELTFRKLLLFWDAREIPNNVALAGEGSTSSLLQLTVPPGILLALGLAGMLLMLKKLPHRQLLPLYLIVIFYWGATAAFYNLSRFRAPILPLLAVFAGIFVAKLLHKSRIDQWKYIRIYGVLNLLAGIFLSMGAYEFYRQILESKILRTVRPAGTSLQLPDGRKVRFYHGPMTFGSWQLLDTPVGTTASVKFPFEAAASARTAEFEFSVQSSNAGDFTVSVAGTIVSTHFSGPQYKKITVRLPEDFSGSTVQLKVLYNSANAGFIADMQRNYGASSLNSREIPGELVMRLTR